MTAPEFFLRFWMSLATCILRFFSFLIIRDTASGLSSAVCFIFDLFIFSNSVPLRARTAAVRMLITLSFDDLIGVVIISGDFSTVFSLHLRLIGANEYVF